MATESLKNCRKNAAASSPEPNPGPFRDSEYESDIEHTSEIEPSEFTRKGALDIFSNWLAVLPYEDKKMLAVLMCEKLNCGNVGVMRASEKQHICWKSTSRQCGSGE